MSKEASLYDLLKNRELHTEIYNHPEEKRAAIVVVVIFLSITVILFTMALLAFFPILSSKSATTAALVKLQLENIQLDGASFGIKTHPGSFIRISGDEVLLYKKQSLYRLEIGNRLWKRPAMARTIFSAKTPGGTEINGIAYHYLLGGTVLRFNQKIERYYDIPITQTKGYFFDKVTVQF